MSKLLSLLFSAVMLAGGLVAFGSSPAQAACPYSGCVRTSTIIVPPGGGADGKVRVGDSPKVCVKVRADEGNADPKGQVSIVVVRGNGGYKYNDTKKYNDSKECFKIAPVGPKGDYVIKARFDKKPGSRWKDSDQRDEFKVYRRD